MVKEFCKKDTIDHERDIVAHQHRTHEVVGMAIESLEEAAGKLLLVLVHLGKHTVARHEGNLHSRKEGGEDHRDEDSYDKWYV